MPDSPPTLTGLSHQELLDTALALVPDTLDKRQGSVIYDALAPFCLALAEFYVTLADVSRQGFAATADGPWLDAIVANMGVTRQPATAAVRELTVTGDDGQPYTSLPAGTRLSLIGAVPPAVYQVAATGPVPGVYRAQAETAGTAANAASGPAAVLDGPPGITTAVLGALLVPGDDTETDSQLRARYADSVTHRAFGGNVAQYRELVLGLAGVGQVQVWPVWAGGGTVKISLVDPQNNPVTPQFAETIRQQLDPDPGQGLGLAPIDHTVTVDTATEVTLDITGLVVTDPYTSPGQASQQAVAHVQAYIDTLRSQWGQATQTGDYQLTCYVSQITAAILDTPGVLSVSAVTVNGSAADLAFQETPAVHEMPALGTVALHA